MKENLDDSLRPTDEDLQAPDSERIIGLLASSQLFKNYQRAFKSLTGMRIFLVPIDRLHRSAWANGGNGGWTVEAPVQVGRDVRVLLQAFGERGARMGGNGPLTRRQRAGAKELLTLFADHLSEASNHIFIEARGIEPAVIRRAKAYIRSNCEARISLSGTARALNLSPSYLCKRFREATGLTFSEYVGRIRVERAKALLLAPDARICEVAFEAGFQSLTHFNRVFKRLTGMAPRQFRRNGFRS